MTVEDVKSFYKTYVDELLIEIASYRLLHGRSREIQSQMIYYTLNPEGVSALSSRKDKDLIG